MSQYSLSVLCHFVALADCIRSGYVGGQFVITRNILSFFLKFFIITILAHHPSLNLLYYIVPFVNGHDNLLHLLYCILFARRHCDLSCHSELCG